MELCDKLCKKFFHSAFKRSDIKDESPEILTLPQIESNSNETLNQTTSVNFIPPTSSQSPSKSLGQRFMISDSKRYQNSDVHDQYGFIEVDIRGQDEPIEPTLVDTGLECKIDIGADLCQMKITYDNEHSTMGKSPADCLLDEIENGIEFAIKEEICLILKEAIKDGGYKHDIAKRLASKYGDLGGELILMNLPNPRLSNCNLGLKLSGNKNLNTMGVFICQITPNSLVEIDGRLQVGDEILEVDDHIIFGRSHLNASPIIKGCSQKMIKFVIHRSVDWLTNMAIPVTYRRIEDCNSNGSSRRGSILDYVNDKDGNPSRKISSISLGQIPNYIPSISTEEAHIIYLNKGSQGFGFAIMEGSFTNEEGIFIKHIAPSGPAAQDGSFRPGDKLISINNQDVSSASYDTALELLKNSKGQVRLVVTRVRCSLSPTHSSGSPVKTIYQKRLSAPHITTVPMNNRPISPTIIEEKSEDATQGISIKTIPESESGLTTLARTMTNLNVRRRSSLSNLPNADVVTMIMNHMIEDDKIELVSIRREKNPLGMAIIGGSDTFIGDVIVHDIFARGVIARDGRIKVGDRILMINNESVMNKTNEQVLVLLHTSCPEINLKIRHPDSPILNQDIYEVVTTVELMKKPMKGLGISIIGREGAKGVYICDIVKGGLTDSDGRLQTGDQILEINGQNFRNETQEVAAITLKCLMGPVVLKIGRIQRMNQHYTPGYLLPRDDTGDKVRSLGKRLASYNGTGHSPARSPMISPAHAR